MRLPYGVQSRIAREVGISVRYLQQLLKGERIPSPKLALKLEKVTNVSRLKWLYPNEFGSPLSELKEQKWAPEQSPNSPKDT